MAPNLMCDYFTELHRRVHQFPKEHVIRDDLHQNLGGILVCIVGTAILLWSVLYNDDEEILIVSSVYAALCGLCLCCGLVILQLKCKKLMAMSDEQLASAISDPNFTVENLLEIGENQPLNVEMLPV